MELTLTRWQNQRLQTSLLPWTYKTNIYIQNHISETKLESSLVTPTDWATEKIATSKQIGKDKTQSCHNHTWGTVPYNGAWSLSISLKSEALDLTHIPPKFWVPESHGCGSRWTGHSLVSLQHKDNRNDLKQTCKIFQPLSSHPRISPERTGQIPNIQFIPGRGLPIHLASN
jgi:hypothetical protein